MPNLKYKIDKIRKVKSKSITGVTKTAGQIEKSSESGLQTLSDSDSFFDFLIGGALIVVAFVFGRK